MSLHVDTIDLDEWLKQRIVEAECPACGAALQRGVCSCCGSFSVTPTLITLRKGDNPACTHWPIQVGNPPIIGWPEGEIEFGAKADMPVKAKA